MSGDAGGAGGAGGAGEMPAADAASLPGKERDQHARELEEAVDEGDGSEVADATQQVVDFAPLAAAAAIGDQKLLRSLITMINDLPTCCCPLPPASTAPGLAVVS